jgi:hypothetical protein
LPDIFLKSVSISIRIEAPLANQETPTRAQL